MSSLYYSVKEIKEKEHCGRDRAYELAKSLPHEIRGRDIYVFAEDYDSYYAIKREEAIEKCKANSIPKNNIYQMRKFN